jgi:phage-related minor tail protein
VDDLKIRLELEGAEQVQTGATKAADGLNKLGQAGQRAGQQAQLSGQQMAQVSAQLQDLFVQIQGGQAPITAILQQGSQLSAVFGGVGNAARAVASAIGPVGAVVGIAAGSIAALGLAYNQGAEEAKAYARAMILSGNAADVTVGQLQEMARAQSLIVGTQGEAAAALTKLAATGQVSAGSLESAAEAAVRFARVGGDIDAVAKSFAKLGGAPLKGLIDLNEAENFLTVSVYRQVKALTEQGRTAEAAAVAQQAYAAAVNGRAQQLEQSLGTVERAWMAVKDSAKLAWDAMLNIGRADTGASLDREIAVLQRRQQILAGGNAQQQTEAILIGQRIAALQTQRDALGEVEREQRRYADMQAQSARATKTVIEADEKAAEAAKKLARLRDEENAALERAVGLSGSYQKDLAELLKLRQQGRLTEEQYIKAVENLIKVQPVVREQLEAQATAQKTTCSRRSSAAWTPCTRAPSRPQLKC